MDDFDDDEASTLFIEAAPPQQSFIFGPDQFVKSSRGPDRGADRGADRDLIFSNAYTDEVLSHEVHSLPSLPSAPSRPSGGVTGPVGQAASQQVTDWTMVFRHWILSSLLLPLYALGLVTVTWRNTPNQLTRFQGVLVIAFSCIFYGLLWTSFALLIAYPSIGEVFPPQQAGFVVFIYLMVCFAESMLKNTHTDGNVPTSIGGTGEEVVTRRGEKWSLDAFADTLFFVAAVTPRQLRTVLITTVLISLIYSGIIAALHVYFIVEKSVPVLAPLVIYTVIETVLQGALCFFILFPLSQVAVRLSVRDKVAREFADSTSLHTSTSSGGDHYFQLDSLANIRAWQTIRDGLIHRYAFPSLYVDVVISAAFTLWVPLVVTGAMDFLFRATITPLALNAVVLAVLVLIYLLICVVLASKVQDRLANTDILRWQEYAFLVSGRGTEDSNLMHVLKRLARLIDEGKENAIVFQVWGFPLNQKMATFLGGILVTLFSSVVVKTASKVASF
jgi:hypothetical protein